MPKEQSEDATALLHLWRGGDETARDALLGVLYHDLLKVARGMLRHDSMRAELQPTELVHESALRLLKENAIEWHDRSHFLAIAATVMRRILVDQARRMNSVKRRGKRVTLLTHHASTTRRVDLEALDEAMKELADISSQRAQIVELRFFGGLTNEEIAVSLGVSASTVKRNWRTAKAWLFSRLQPVPSGGA